jgi:hypothetical protein
MIGTADGLQLLPAMARRLSGRQSCACAPLNHLLFRCWVTISSPLYLIGVGNPFRVRLKRSRCNRRATVAAPLESTLFPMDKRI